MARIKPFRGYRYRLQSSDELGRYAAPPYDMIGSRRRDELYEQSPYNVVRIIQNRPEPGDRANRDRHVRARELLSQWLSAGRLVQDTQPSLYVYRQIFTPPGDASSKPLVRTGLIAGVQLTDFSEGTVIPHENTLSAPKEDRYELLETLRCHTGQIFGIVPDEGDLVEVINACSEGPPAGSFTDEWGVRHELRLTSDKALVDRAAEGMAEKRVLIADGHHRYETALGYARRSGDPASAYVMMTLVSMADPGLRIRPFHRLVRVRKEVASADALRRLQEFFECRDAGEAAYDVVREFMARPEEAGMLYLDRAGGRLYRLVPNETGERFLADEYPEHSAAWRHLNVSRINAIFVGGILGLPLDGTTLHDVMEYENDAFEAWNRVRGSEEFYGAFFIHPLAVRTVEEIVAGGERMPQKSTNFFPKCYSGLVLCPMENA